MKKERYYWLCRACPKDSVYEQYNRKPQQTPDGIWALPGFFARIFPRIWHRYMPTLRLRPGQCRRVRVMVDGKRTVHEFAEE